MFSKNFFGTFLDSVGSADVENVSGRKETVTGL